MQDYKSELTLKEAMAVAEVCQKTIYNWCGQDFFKHRRAVNRRLFIDRDTFFEFINGRLETLNGVSRGVEN